MPTKSINQAILRKFPQNRNREVIHYYQPMQIHPKGIIKGDQGFGLNLPPRTHGISLGDLVSFKNDTSIHHVSERQAEKALESVVDRIKDVGHGLEKAKQFVPSPPSLPSGPKILGVVGQMHSLSFHPNQHMVNEGLEAAKKVEHVIGRLFHF